MGRNLLGATASLVNIYKIATYLDDDLLNIAQIKNALFKKAMIFQTGGFRPCLKNFFNKYYGAKEIVAANYLLKFMTNP